MERAELSRVSCMRPEILRFNIRNDAVKEIILVTRPSNTIPKRN